jgi:hypothetical protein
VRGVRPHWRDCCWHVLNAGWLMYKVFKSARSIENLMSSRTVRISEKAAAVRFTHLVACIIQEEDGYTIKVKLYNEAKPRNTAWGEEIADSVETASSLIGALAEQFSIPQSCIEIEVQMDDLKAGTRH